MAAPVRKAHARLSNLGVVACFVLIGLSLIVFSGQIVFGMVQASASTTVAAVSSTQTPVAQPTQINGLGSQSVTRTPSLSSISPTVTTTPTVNIPFFMPNANDAALPTLQLPADHYILYQETGHLFLISTTDNSVEPLYTPGYNYNQAVRPLLTSSGQLIYSGSQGLWSTDVFNPQPVEIFRFAANTTLTSLVLSQDGKTVAWSTEPVDGKGKTSIYAGPLSDPQQVYQQSVTNCPCFRIFSFLNSTSSDAHTTLLLTDDRDSNEAVQYGLWSLDITDTTATPQLLIDENGDSQQGPLTLAPYSNTLLYSSDEGLVADPTDGTVPADVASLPYANSLSITALGGAAVQPSNSQVILPEQQNLSNSAQYHWVTTPTFSPDGSTLAYIEFSSDAQSPYDRHSALYTVKITGSGSQLQTSQPQLVATSTVNLLELGPWLNSHVVTLCGDGSLYALDVLTGALTTLDQPGGYIRILGVIGTGQT